MSAMCKPRSMLLLVFLVLMTLVVSGCSTPATPTPTQVPPTAVPPTAVPTAMPTPATRTITYYDGQSVTVPTTITRIASGWNAQNSIIAMLGYGDKIVATTDIIKASPVFGKFVPSIKNAVLCFTGSDVNVEALVGAKPDVAFIMTGASLQWKNVEDAGIPVAYLKPNSLQNLLDRTLITGQILGDAAYQHAQEYVEYFNNNVTRVESVVSQIPADQRMRLYHCLSGGLNTSARPSLNQDWMDKAGVINVAENWTLTASSAAQTTNATLEQVIGANPDVILAMNRADANAILTDPAWANIKAVKEGKVYTNPKGMFWWCRETTEEALQFLWLAKTVYPTYFADVDMAAETRYFYKTFYGYDLTDEEVQSFLNPS